MPNTAKYPAELAAQLDLLEASNRASTTLSGAVLASDLSITVASTALFAVPCVITIENERIRIAGKTPTVLTVASGGRGFDGSTAADHADTLPVLGNATAWHHNQLAAEIIAIETAMGVGWISGSAVLDFPSIPRGESKSLTFLATGALTSKVVLVGPPNTWDDEVSFCAKVSAADTVRVIVTNNRADGTEYDPPSGSWVWRVL